MVGSREEEKEGKKGGPAAPNKSFTQGLIDSWKATKGQGKSGGGQAGAQTGGRTGGAGGVGGMTGPFRHMAFGLTTVKAPEVEIQKAIEAAKNDVRDQPELVPYMKIHGNIEVEPGMTTPDGFTHPKKVNRKVNNDKEMQGIQQSLHEGMSCRNRFASFIDSKEEEKNEPIANTPESECLCAPIARTQASTEREAKGRLTRTRSMFGYRENIF